jgi:hypothetical protein
MLCNRTRDGVRYLVDQVYDVDIDTAFSFLGAGHAEAVYGDELSVISESRPLTPRVPRPVRYRSDDDILGDALNQMDDRLDGMGTISDRPGVVGATFEQLSDAQRNVVTSYMNPGSEWVHIQINSPLVEVQRGQLDFRLYNQFRSNSRRVRVDTLPHGSDSPELVDPDGWVADPANPLNLIPAANGRVTHRNQRVPKTKSPEVTKHEIDTYLAKALANVDIRYETNVMAVLVNGKTADAVYLSFFNMHKGLFKALLPPPMTEANNWATIVSDPDFKNLPKAETAVPKGRQVKI